MVDLLTHHSSRIRSYFFFVASHLPVICPAKSNSPTSLPSLIIAVIPIEPLGVSSEKLSLFPAQVPLLSGTVPCADSEEPVTLSPSSLSLRVKGIAVPCASAFASQSPVNGSPAAGAAGAAAVIEARLSSRLPP